VDAKMHAVVLITNVNVENPPRQQKKKLENAQIQNVHVVQDADVEQLVNVLLNPINGILERSFKILSNKPNTVHD